MSRLMKLLLICWPFCSYCFGSSPISVNLSVVPLLKSLSNTFFFVFFFETNAGIRQLFLLMCQSINTSKIFYTFDNFFNKILS